MGSVTLLFSAFLAVVVVSVFCQKSPSDHQTVTYYSQFKPAVVSDGSMTLTAFFSPDHSTDTLTNLLESAEVSIDIGIPSWASWCGCTPFGDGGGCGFEFLRDHEEFPIFRVLVNAVHKGIKVRILTNNYEENPATGAAYPQTYAQLAGADVRYYTSTTFYHAKYFMVDGKKAAVSSVNWSWTSYMHNREAGFIIEGDDAGPLIQFMNDVFESDWDVGIEFPVGSYNASDMAIVNNKSQLQVTIPKPPFIANAYVTTVHAITDTFDEVAVYTSPDYAWEYLTAALNASKTSVNIYIYQITNGGFCQMLSTLHQSGIDVELLVSDHIYSQTDYEAAQACYTIMYNAGITIYKTDAYTYSYSHNKYAVIDGELTFLSTGNMGSTDYPQASVFPPYGSPHWVQANRDFSVHVKSTTMAAVFTDVYTQDKQRGWEWTPSSN